MSAVNTADPRWTDAHVFAGALKLYLRELPEPVFTYELYAEFVKAGSELKYWLETSYHLLFLFAQEEAKIWRHSSTHYGR